MTKSQVHIVRKIQMGGEVKREKMSAYGAAAASRGSQSDWFRGENTDFYPTYAQIEGPNAVADYVLKGWAPPQPLIDRSTKIVAFGSCFAANITRWLAKRNFNVLTAKDGEAADTYIVRFNEGMVNTFVIRQQFEWAFENKVFTEELWHGYSAEAFGYDENIRLATAATLMKADVFIITLGLSEIWYDEVSGGVFWRSVPSDKYNPSRHRFRVSSVAENRENITVIHNLIRKYRPEAKIIFTLSPVPLKATFRAESCITANTVSKAILRAALDEFLREYQPQDSSLFYWPSYEIVMDIFEHRWEADRRHAKEDILNFIMRMFEEAWCIDSKPNRSILDMWVTARSVSGTLPARAPHVLKNHDKVGLRKILAKLGRKNPKDAALLRQAVIEMGGSESDLLGARKRDGTGRKGGKNRKGRRAER